MRRWLAVLIALVVFGGLAVRWFAPWLLSRIEPPIRVGILHSRTGPMRISEESMIEAELLAIKEINEAGGLLGGRLVEGVIADGRSEWPTFGSEAERLIDKEKVSVIFGCWTSASRKSVKPVVEQKEHLLIYPMAYEGLEQSPHIVYTGAAPNQQVIPAVSWCFEKLKARKFFLVGSDYVWPHCVNEIIKDELKALGAECAGESYILFGSAAVDDAVAAIGKAAPDVIISTVVGDSNEPFYRRLEAAGIVPGRTPVVSFSIAEDELRKLPVKAMVGDYAAWDYFQSINRPENRAFVQRFKAVYGTDRVTSDVMEAAYNSVYLWAQAVAEAETAEVAHVLKAIGRQSLNAPEGIVSVDEETQHTWRPVSIGRIRSDGQFDVVWTSEKPIRPIPYPPSRTQSEWESFLESLYRDWGGWANPGSGKTRPLTAGAIGPLSLARPGTPHPFPSPRRGEGDELIPLPGRFGSRGRSPLSLAPFMERVPERRVRGNRLGIQAAPRPDRAAESVLQTSSLQYSFRYDRP
jgi:urea transport system substrate-binding protein